MVNNKKLYVSKYVMITKISDKEYVIIHSYLNNIDIVSSDIAIKLLKNDINWENLDDNTINRMIENGYLVEDVEEDKRRFFEVAQKLHKLENKYYPYIIIPSYNCNFRCPYCFEGNITRKNNKIMSKSMVDRIFVNLKRDKCKGRIVSLSLFGGEPLLKEHLKINKYIIKKAINNKMKISAITNGYDLDYYMPYIRRNIFSNFQITLDGDKECNNKTKYTLTDKDVFTKVINNIDKILSITCNTMINVRLNTGKGNINSFSNLFNVFKEKGFLNNKRFSFYTKSIQECGNRISQQLFDFQIIDKVKFYDDRLQNMATNSAYRLFINEYSKIFDIKQKIGSMKVDYCGATNNTKLIDPDGDIYTCLEEVGNKSQRVGFLYHKNNRIKYTKLKKLWENRKVYKIEKCSNCAYSLLCVGGCPVQAKKTTGSLYSPYCSDTKKICNDVIREMVKRVNI